MMVSARQGPCPAGGLVPALSPRPCRSTPRARLQPGGLHPMTSTAPAWNVPTSTRPTANDPTSSERDDYATLCDDTLALAFSLQVRDSARYVAAWRRWMVFDGVRWRADDTLRL